MNALDGTFAHPSSVPFGIITIGCSGGGLIALQHLLGALPADFSVPIVIVQHMSPDHPSHLARILNWSTPLTITAAQEGDVLRAGHVYVPVPARHLIVTAEGTLSLTDTEKVYHRRPAIDVLFESAAEQFQEKVIGVILTGGGHDGVNGIRAIKQAGGVTISQNEATSEVVGMPRNVIETGEVDHVLALDTIAPLLIGLCQPVL